jgi:hypothetical protein
MADHDDHGSDAAQSVQRDVARFCADWAGDPHDRHYTGVAPEIIE